MGPGMPAAFWAWGWPSDPTPSSPKAVLKRLMGVEPSVMRADFRPRLWSSFTWKGKRGAGRGTQAPVPFSAPRPHPHPSATRAATQATLPGGVWGKKRGGGERRT